MKLWSFDDESKNREVNIKEAECSSWSIDSDETYLRELVEEDQHSTTRKQTQELEVSAMTISRAMLFMNLSYTLLDASVADKSR